MPGRLKIVGIGAGGHAKVLVDIIEQTGAYEVVGFTDADKNKRSDRLMGYPILGTDEKLEQLYRAGVRNAFIGVGAVSSHGTRLRAKLFNRAVNLGFKMATLVHPAAVVSPGATIGEGSVIMPKAVISVGARTGVNTVVYSGAVIEHDSAIRDHVHVSPGAMIAGEVTIEEGAFIGIGASIIQGITVGAWATVGGGAVVLTNVPDGRVAVGVPARIIASATDLSKAFG